MKLLGRPVEDWSRCAEANSLYNLAPLIRRNQRTDSDTCETRRTLLSIFLLIVISGSINVLHVNTSPLDSSATTAFILVVDSVRSDDKLT